MLPYCGVLFINEEHLRSPAKLDIYPPNPQTTFHCWCYCLQIGLDFDKRKKKILFEDLYE